jgi:hypothetical protein
MNAESIECANEQCQCFVTAALDPDSGEPTEAYCGGSCRDAAVGEESDVCACGHPQCDA